LELPLHRLFFEAEIELCHPLEREENVRATPPKCNQQTTYQTMDHRKQIQIEVPELDTTVYMPLEKICDVNGGDEVRKIIT